ncbi:MAG: hypothetical protein JNK87_04245 [Bryobacterales bacterium]|nr:hypothetical protein [Bryobacterales bacterium]
MRTTIELPDDLVRRAESAAAQSGISLREFFVEAVEMRLQVGRAKTGRRPRPVIGEPGLPAVNVTREQIDDAMFG